MRVSIEGKRVDVVLAIVVVARRVAQSLDLLAARIGDDFGLGLRILFEAGGRDRDRWSAAYAPDTRNKPVGRTRTTAGPGHG